MEDGVLFRRMFNQAPLTKPIQVFQEFDRRACDEATTVLQETNLGNCGVH